MTDTLTFDLHSQVIFNFDLPVLSLFMLRHQIGVVIFQSDLGLCCLIPGVIAHNGGLLSNSGHFGAATLQQQSLYINRCVCEVINRVKTHISLTTLKFKQEIYANQVGYPKSCPFVTCLRHTENAQTLIGLIKTEVQLTYR